MPPMMTSTSGTRRRGGSPAKPGSILMPSASAFAVCCLMRSTDAAASPMRAPSVRRRAKPRSCLSMKSKKAVMTSRTRRRGVASGFDSHAVMTAARSWCRARSMVAASSPSFEPK